MSDKILKPTVIALGYFDSVHIGHAEVIRRAKQLAEELSASLTVFTFKGNLKAVLSGEKDKYVYSPEERAELLYSLGADDIYFAPVDFGFLSLGKLAFLNKINKKYDIKGYVCGEDYRFGKFGEGAVKDVEAYAASHKQRCIVCETVLSDGKKISTTAVKKLLAAGNVVSANALLGRAYSLSGEIKEGRKVGAALGFPTANFVPDREKQTLKDGVYAGHVFIEGRRYRAVINYGTRPTFHLSDKLAEAHIIDFNGVLYGKTLTVYFDAYIRDTVRFYSEEELKKQIAADKESVVSGKYD